MLVLVSMTLLLILVLMTLLLVASIVFVNHELSRIQDGEAHEEGPGAKQGVRVWNNSSASATALSRDAIGERRRHATGGRMLRGRQRRSKQPQHRGI